MTLAADLVANTPDMVDRFVRLFRDTPVRDLIGNLDTTVDRIDIAGRSYPVTLNNAGVRGNCYICSPVTAYIDYAIDETRNFATHPTLRAAVRGLIRAAAPLVRASGLDAQVQINNWLFSTNPVPSLTRDAAARMRDTLSRDHPTRALVLRSLNDRADAASIAALRAEGFQMLPARQIYLFGVDRDEIRFTPDMRRDRNLLRQTPLRLVPNDAFTDADYARSAQLYDLLYIDKYTPLNPSYTARYVQAMHRSGLMELRGLRDPATGHLVAVTGLFANGRTLTQPIVGYDTSRPLKEGLYRMVMAMAQDHALAHGLFFNMSAGAAGFKRRRMALPVIEYSAAYVDHLPRKQRLATRAMESLLTGIGIPLLQRFEL
jgi:hypothetical protein